MAHDSSGNNNHGRLGNDPTWTAGKIGNALSFDGTNDFVEIPAASSLNEITGEVSVAAWIYLTATGKDQKIFGTQNGSAGGYKLGVHTNDKVEFEIRDSGNTAHLNRGVSGGTVLGTGKWYHTVGVYDDSKDWLATYINGKLDREMSTDGVLASTTKESLIGREPYQNAYYWDGIIDEVRVYNRALTPEVIRQLYETSRFIGVDWKNFEVRVNGRTIEPTSVVYRGDKSTSEKADFGVGDQLEIFLQDELEEGDVLTLVYRPSNQTLMKVVV